MILALLPLQSLAQYSLQHPGVTDESIPQLTESTVKAWRVHRKQILGDVQLVMGDLPDRKHDIPLCPDVLSESVENGILFRKVAYHTDCSSHRVHAWLLTRPRPFGTPLPALLCLHQSTKFGKDELVGLAGNQGLAYALELAELGFVTLSPDYPSFGEYEYDFQDEDYASGSMKAIVDNIRAIDYLSSIKEVDPQSIGVIGHSLGGHNAIFTAIFEPRIKVVVSCCGFTPFSRYQGGDLTGWTSPKYMPRIRDRYQSDPKKVPFDFSDLLAAIAPRPFLAIAPLRDHNFDVRGVREAVSAAKPIYSLYSAENYLRAIYPDAQHSFPNSARQQAYKFIAQHLRGT